MLDFITISYVFSAALLTGFSALVIRKHYALQKQYQQLQSSIAEHASSKTS